MGRLRHHRRTWNHHGVGRQAHKRRTQRIEGYSQPRRPLVFAQVRDRLPRPVNKPHYMKEIAQSSSSMISSVK